MHEVVHFLSSLEYYREVSVCIVDCIFPSAFAIQTLAILVSHICYRLYIQQTHRLFKWINNKYSRNKFIDLIAFHSFSSLRFCYFQPFYFVCWFLCNDAPNSPYSLSFTETQNNTDIQHFLIHGIKLIVVWVYKIDQREEKKNWFLCWFKAPFGKIAFCDVCHCRSLDLMLWRFLRWIMKNQAFDGRENQFIIISFVSCSKCAQFMCMKNDENPANRMVLNHWDSIYLKSEFNDCILILKRTLSNVIMTVKCICTTCFYSLWNWSFDWILCNHRIWHSNYYGTCYWVCPFFSTNIFSSLEFCFFSQNVYIQIAYFLLGDADAY